MVFRTIQLHAPRSLLGWECGTLEVQPEAHSDDLPDELHSCRLKLRTSLGKGRLHADGNGKWKAKHERSLKLPVRKRHSSAILIEFRRAFKLIDKIPVFAVLWLSEIPDDEEQFLTLPVWRGDLKRAETCCLDRCGEKVGSIQLKVTFWRGLSGYHAKLARKERSLEDVMEVVDTANAQDLAHGMGAGDDVNGSGGGSGGGNDSDSENSSGSDDESVQNGDTSPGSHQTKEELSTDDGKRGPISQLKDYKHHRKQLHRMNRGLMQWKVHHHRLRLRLHLHLRVYVLLLIFL